MIHSRSQLLRGCFFLSDLVVTAAAWLGAYHLRFDSGWLPVTKPRADFALCWRALPLVLLLGAVAYRLAGQYDIHRLRRFREEMIAVFKGTALLTLLVLASLFAWHRVLGSVSVETVFGWPGAGQYVVQAIFNLDMPVILGFAVLTAFAYVLFNTLTDLVYAALDPRVRVS